MKKLKMVITAIACLVITCTFSQNEGKAPDNKPAKCPMEINDAGFSLSVFSQKTPFGTFTDFQMLNPKSVLLSGNMQGYTMSKGAGSIGGPAFGASIGIGAADKDNTDNKSTTQLRIGISFSGLNMSNSLTKTDRVPFDTLTSSQTGQTIYSDSVTYHNYSMIYTSQQVRFDVSFIYRTNPAARWSVYGGLGLEGGESIIAYTDIDYNEYSSITPSSGLSTVDNTDKSSTERIVNKNNYGYAAYLPLGIDFRVGTKREFFKQFHISLETRPFVNYINIPELGTTGGLGVKVGLGLRVTI